MKLAMLGSGLTAGAHLALAQLVQGPEDAGNAAELAGRHHLAASHVRSPDLTAHIRASCPTPS